MLRRVLPGAAASALGDGMSAVAALATVALALATVALALITTAILAASGHRRS